MTATQPTQQEWQRKVNFLERRLRDSENRAYYLQQELLSIVDEGLARHKLIKDHIYVGRTIGTAGKPSIPFYLPLRAVQRSMTVVGRMGVGKSNMLMLGMRQLMLQGIGVFLIDKSGEGRALFEPEETIYDYDIQFNPFDDLDGYWSDSDLHGIIQESFFSFLNARRGATNLGNLSKLLAHYFQQYPRGMRSIPTFYSFIIENQDHLGVPAATAGNLKSFLEWFIHTPSARSMFCVERTCDKIRNVILRSGNGCLVVTNLADLSRSVISVSIMMMAARKLERDFLEKGSTQERPLTQVLVIEETADIIKGDSEKRWLASIHRDGRKRGCAVFTVPRNFETLQEIGVLGLLSEVGVVAFFGLNEVFPIRNKDLNTMLQQYGTKLQVGEAIFYVNGQISLVKVEKFHDMAEDRAPTIAGAPMLRVPA